MPNSFVDSRSPRRLPSIRMPISTRLIVTRLTCSDGTADVIAETPAAMLTATVKV